MKNKSKSPPIQPVERPIICSPYEEPSAHWIYDKKTGQPSRFDSRREAGYWYKTERTGSQQGELFVEEERDDLPLVNLLRKDVGRWRDTNYRGASIVTRELLNHWSRSDRIRRLFFCQLEAVETIIYLAEIRLENRSSSTGFKKFNLTDTDIENLLNGVNPSFSDKENDFFPTLVDFPADDQLNPLRRMCCKMATGSGKTIVMSMLIAWAFCNRGKNPQNIEFPNVALVCCPNLTIKERLQVLRPEYPENYYSSFDIVPNRFRPLLSMGKVIVMNWHALTPESEHIEGGKHYAVVNKGEETSESFAKRILGNSYDCMPIMVFNDEGHHCWRAKQSELNDELRGDEKKELETEAKTATVWIEGLDKLNNCTSSSDSGGIKFCIDLSATPFYIKGSGHQEGHPFPWIVSDFGLVDAIESGLVKIPRIPVQDTTGLPDPKYFKLWESIKDKLRPVEMLPGRLKKPKPDVIFKKAEGALQQIAGQWVDRYKYIQEGTVNQDKVPPVLIIVCDNIEIAKYFFQKISGEREAEEITQDEVEEALNSEQAVGDDIESFETNSKANKKIKGKTKIVYGMGEVFPEYFSNTRENKYTIRIDSQQLAEFESEFPEKKKQDSAAELLRIVSTVGKSGEPGENVRCVVSVAMLNEGWDANNVTQILGIRAFGSQLLCEQVVGRGLRRLDYSPDPKTGLLTEEYVDIYGIPFSVIPFKGRVTKGPQPEDKPKNHVQSIPERDQMEIKFPNVESFAFSLTKNLIQCDIDSMESLVIQPNKEPTATFVSPTVGYQKGPPSAKGSFSFDLHDRDTYYNGTHIQSIMFLISNEIVNKLVAVSGDSIKSSQRVFRLQSRHTLFPQVFNIVSQYVQKKVDFQGQNECELGLKEYVERIIDRLLDGIEPSESEGEPPLLPLLNRYKPIGSTAEVDFKTTRPCFATKNSHVNLVVADTKTWETSAAFKIEQAVENKSVKYYVRNDSMGFVIPYVYNEVNHLYEPDFIVRMDIPEHCFNVVLEIKGHEDDQTKAKHQAAKRWVSAINNWGQLGNWEFYVCRNPQTLDEELMKLKCEFSSKST